MVFVHLSKEAPRKEPKAFSPFHFFHAKCRLLIFLLILKEEKLKVFSLKIFPNKIQWLRCVLSVEKYIREL